MNRPPFHLRPPLHPYPRRVRTCGSDPRAWTPRARRPRVREAAWALTGACAVLLVSLTLTAQAFTARARAAHALKAMDTAYLHLASSSGALLLEEGNAMGTVPGKVRAHCSIGPTVSAKFTIYTHVGSISGSGSGKLSSTGRQPSFGGTMTVTGGTGRYAHAHGHGGFYGVLNRDTDAITLQTTGTLNY